MSFVVLPNGRNQFVTETGAPAVGYKVYAFVPGTSTPKDTYTDYTGGSANTHPIVLDARGEAAIYWSGTYDVVLKDPAGVTIWGPERVVEPDPAGAAADVLTSLAASGGSSLVGFIQSGSGAVARTVQGKIRDAMPYVTDFGGVMDNSSSGVRTANSAALLLALALNRCVRIPAGTFWIDPSTDLGGYFHIVGEGSNATFIKGDGDLLKITASDNGEMRLIEHLTILNDSTRGKLFTSNLTTNRVAFNYVNFAKATYHIYSSSGDAVSWSQYGCRFSDASIESQHYEGLWVFSQDSCYTWESQVGIRCTNGNVSSCSIIGSVFEQINDSAIILDASDASFEVDGFIVTGTHFEVNGKTTNAADIALLTSAATRLRNITMNGVGFFTPTATQTVRVSVSAGGGGNIDYVNIENSCLMGAVALCTNVTAVKARNIYFQSLSMPTGVTVPVTVNQSFGGKYLGSESIVGASAGSSAVTATGSTIPSGTLMAIISVQGNIYNGAADTHTGYLEARYFASGSRFAALNDVNNGAGANQGFVAGLSGGAIQITNKAAMTNNQSGDVVISYWR